MNRAERLITAFATVAALSLSHAAIAAAPVKLERPQMRTPIEDRRAEAAAFEGWKSEFTQSAIAAGHEKAAIEALLSGLRIDHEIIRLDQEQPEFVRTLGNYFERAVSDERVLFGQAKAAKNQDKLRAIEARFGVDWSAIVSIWGLETAYGAVRGDFDIPRSLATLAFEGRRRSFAEKELMALLDILEAGDARRAELVGSWAGAMGHTQFMPTSYLAFAQDFAGDGKRHIWGDDPSDALASTAFYLAEHGWQRGAPKMVEITLPAGFDYALAADETRRSNVFWELAGIQTLNGSPLPPAEDIAIVLPSGASGPAFAAYPNFFAIKAYNNSNAYALAVSHLGDRIEGKPPLKAKWPDDIRTLPQPLRAELQRRLTEAGFDTFGADGIIGPNSRRAIRDYQTSVGLPADGFASDKLLQHLGGEIPAYPED